jgi:hypothetical protein
MKNAASAWRSPRNDRRLREVEEVKEVGKDKKALSAERAGWDKKGRGTRSPRHFVPRDDKHLSKGHSQVKTDNCFASFAMCVSLSSGNAVCGLDKVL